MEQITVVGAGLAGALLSVFLAKQGYAVSLLESRKDVRSEPDNGGRSINLALSCRGLTALREAGLAEQISDILVPMRARAIHQESGELLFQDFGRHHDEYINAVRRHDLNSILLDIAETQPNIKTAFEMRLCDIDYARRTLVMKAPDGRRIEQSFDRLIACDGASSFVRDWLRQRGYIQSSRTYFPHGYKELTLAPPGFRGFKQEHLHLWPRDGYMLLGNPNTDGSMTGSLFLAHEGEPSFATLNTTERVRDFLEQSFHNAYEAYPDMVAEFIEHPVGTMSTIKSEPWHLDERILLLGDAAHGIIPFFGQGMNAAFEDCRILDGMLQQYRGDWSRVMPEFCRARKPNTDAVAKMSEDNYAEIQLGIRDPEFNLRKALELALMHRFPERYVSKHVLVMFSNTPYRTAYEVGVLQKEFLIRWTENISDLHAIDWSKVERELGDYDKKLTGIMGS